MPGTQSAHPGRGGGWGAALWGAGGGTKTNHLCAKMIKMSNPVPTTRVTSPRACMAIHKHRPPPHCKF
eukprot:3827328-Prymnesium_polylepis.1